VIRSQYTVVIIAAHRVNQRDRVIDEAGATG
jgi:hypothetical protein